MRKAIPIINAVLLYLIIIPFVIDIEVYDKFFNDYIGPFYYPAVFISGILNIICAFYLYKKNDEKNLKFSMCICVFGLIPYYLICTMFWIILVVFASRSSIVGAVLLALAWLFFVLWTNAFYGLSLAKLENRSLSHRICHFIPVVNIFAAIRLLRKRKAD